MTSSGCRSTMSSFGFPRFVPLIFLATSYEGLLLLLQIPFSALCALVAVALAFPKKTRRISAGFAWVGILITVVTAGLELSEYGLHSFRDEDTVLFLSAVFSPLIVCSVVLWFRFYSRLR